ncbi:hypothetical protein S140_219 [Shewanella sp. phage 1/40]|uniref:hypothetical protein n=1 Tax=Shewanella sp. phage 1/40 TaxID=1458860 RepID=UPI0004F613D0|nr:hypothetical protein S140_219 [Shewanella sp. phage 1/40]AHK11626.1 hypothetical protein S140_219 [Shewanella sp. phage 1/40]
MKTYIFTVENNSNQRGYNRTVNVYHIKNNKPTFVGYDDKINTASYKGDYAIACKIISENDKHRMNKTGYRLESKNIEVISI